MKKEAKEEKNIVLEAIVNFWLYFKKDWLRLD